MGNRKDFNFPQRIYRLQGRVVAVFSRSVSMEDVLSKACVSGTPDKLTGSPLSRGDAPYAGVFGQLPGREFDWISDASPDSGCLWWWPPFPWL